MENRYPLFAGGRILKKEALWDLRDYSYGSWQMYYADYTDGIVKGCRVRVEGSDLVIGRGILKYRNFIYLLEEEAKVPFAAENRLIVLKAVIEEIGENFDYLTYAVNFFLDSNQECQENQMELCRFHLREGSVLRDVYKDFSDMNTEYDTINLLYATMAGRGEGRMHPEILLRYAQELQKSDTRSMEDIAFAYHVLQTEGEVERKVVGAYLQEKCKREISVNEAVWENRQCFELMEALLNQRLDSWENGQGHRVIFVE